jgi:hypothetical protein
VTQQKTVRCGDGEFAGSLPGLATGGVDLASYASVFNFRRGKPGTRAGAQKTAGESLANVGYITVWHA